MGANTKPAKRVALGKPRPASRRIVGTPIELPKKTMGTVVVRPFNRQSMSSPFARLNQDEQRIARLAHGIPGKVDNVVRLVAQVRIGTLRLTIAVEGKQPVFSF